MAKRSQSSSIYAGQREFWVCYGYKEDKNGFSFCFPKQESLGEKMALTFGVNGKRKRRGRKKRGWWSTY